MPQVQVIQPIQQQPKRLRVAAYARVSSDSTDQLNSLSVQVDYYTHLIQENPNWDFAGIYADEGITGTSTKHREQFNRLLDDCRAGLIDRVLVKSASRFARNTADALASVREMKSLGVTVVFEKEGFDTETANGEMILSMICAAAQEESLSISQNTKWGIRKKMHDGTYITSLTPFGYKKIDRQLFPDEKEAATVKEIFNLFLNGFSTAEIANHLNTNHPKPDVIWRSASVRFILRNEKYIGDSLYQKTYRTATVPFKQKKNYGSEDQIYAEGTHEGFIDRDTFDKVQTLLKKRKIQHSRITEQTIYPFTHRIQCSECGAFYRRRIIGGSIAWGCVTHINDRTKCDSHYYREDRIMDAFIGIINRLRFAEEGIVAESIELTEKAILLKKRNNLQAMESSQSMAELNAKLLMLEQLKSKGYLAPDVFESQSREINGQINEIKTKRIQSLSSALDLALEEFKTLQARLNEIDEPLDSFDPKLFEEVIKGMTVNNRDEMTFRLIGDLTFTVRL